MSIQLYNTLTRKKEIFTPIQEGKISMYVCGVTVYDVCHMGHARAYVVFDLWRRLFESEGYEVTFVQNFTDIDDKIIARAQELKIHYRELTEKIIQDYFSDMDMLNIQRATRYPKATEYISNMQQLIQTLLDKGVAYEKHGAVYFSVEAKDDYGKLSQKVLDDLEAGSRVAVESIKKNPFDFILWKPSKEGEPSWDSPWGPGRPGWHIECSAMAMHELGDTIDIHAGGQDLIFPHHENEIAQSECCSGKPFANYWLHNGFVTIKHEKMSKSKKNFFGLRDVLEEIDANVLRYFLMRVHYRAPLNYAEEAIEDAKQAYNRLAETVRLHHVHTQEISESLRLELMQLESKFLDALRDDLNISEALAQLFEMSKQINKEGCGTEYLLKCAGIIGLTFDLESNPIPEHIQVLVDKRQEAKQAKNYALADQLRDQIIASGYDIKDTPDGPVLRQI